ncbi:hydrophobe/amphiphile efflux-1 (HAE1) family protein [Desulfosalsimonas propionicica]|uniref:Hydrophobe/amphiphile efflux-1 (HAE1) family protein n=1 Tax=Desulfosalsimonas propionicica TaxID=332175 RepID=A0A7W0HLH2_9BACT|nr:efflux RND transporter permease subunit [Desulfosalsimonas propionicica]MBA2882305.1 hydrophobe/amphiphile efflux-1 (HAE1) family protein [Desulfosalsimonas propionicica]
MIWNLCIRRPVLTTVLFLVIFIFGLFGYNQMPVREYPDVEFPIVNVSAVLPGADPEVIETEVVEPLEEQLNTIEGVKEIKSTSREQVGVVTVEFELYRDIDLAAQDVRDRVTRARPDMADDIEEPVIRKVDPDAQAVMWISLRGDKRWDPVSMTEYADTVIKNRLERLPGVGQIFIGGERKYAVRIRLDPDKLAGHNLTAREVVEKIQAQNIDIPSGRIESREREFLIKTEGRFADAAPFNDIIITHRNGSPVRLADVGEAVDGVENDRNVARYNTEPSVGLGVVKQSDANLVDVVERVRREMKSVEKDFLPGLRYQVASDDSEFISENINDLITTIFIATALVAVVILFFLGTIRGTVIAAITIPTSLLAGMAVIFYLGFSLNVLSLLGLILVVGLVVDDAIVVLESCYRHMEHGADAKPAARTGTTEIAFAAIANTLALLSVFIPVAFMPGMIGRFFFEFGLTVAVTVLASTFTALTLTPMLCSRYLRAPAAYARRPVVFRFTEVFFKTLEKIYNPILNAALRQRAVTVGIAVLALGAGLFFLTRLESEFVPSSDEGQFMIAYETVEGATLTNTDRYGKQIEEILSGVDEIRSFFMAIGMARTGPGKVNEGMVFVRLTHYSERDRNQQAIMAEVREKMDRLTGVRGYAIEGGGPVGAEAPLQVVLTHQDIEQLAGAQEQVMNWMRSQPDFTGVRADMKLNKPEVQAWVNRKQAEEMGITVAEIANTLRFVFGEPDITEIERQGERYDVITEIVERENIPDAINRIYLRNQDGQMVNMAHLVELEEGSGPSEIHHFNRARATTISSDLPPGVPLGRALSKVEGYIDTEVPAEFDSAITGQSRDFRESFFYLTMALVFAIVFIFLVMSGQFESFLHPLTILMALPLAGVGAFGALWALNMTINIFSFIGIIMLLGLVTKNAILLVDYTNVLVARGQPVMEATRQAARVRFRPVLMTAISTILGMAPIALGFGAGGEARAPMGVAISMGMFAATALTLLVIPVAYTLFDSLQTRILRHRVISLAAAGIAAALVIMYLVFR